MNTYRPMNRDRRDQERRDSNARDAVKREITYLEERRVRQRSPSRIRPESPRDCSRGLSPRSGETSRHAPNERSRDQSMGCANLPQVGSVVARLRQENDRGFYPPSPGARMDMGASSEKSIAALASVIQLIFQTAYESAGLQHEIEAAELYQRDTDPGRITQSSSEFASVLELFRIRNKERDEKSKRTKARLEKLRQEDQKKTFALAKELASRATGAQVSTQVEELLRNRREPDPAAMVKLQQGLRDVRQELEQVKSQKDMTERFLKDQQVDTEKRHLAQLLAAREQSQKQQDALTNEYRDRITTMEKAFQNQLSTKSKELESRVTKLQQELLAKSQAQDKKLQVDLDHMRDEVVKSQSSEIVKSQGPSIKNELSALRIDMNKLNSAKADKVEIKKIHNEISNKLSGVSDMRKELAVQVSKDGMNTIRGEVAASNRQELSVTMARLQELEQRSNILSEQLKKMDVEGIEDVIKWKNEREELERIVKLQHNEWAEFQKNMAQWQQIEEEKVSRIQSAISELQQPIDQRQPNEGGGVSQLGSSISKLTHNVDQQQRVEEGRVSQLESILSELKQELQGLSAHTTAPANALASASITEASLFATFATKADLDKLQEVCENLHDSCESVPRDCQGIMQRIENNMKTWKETLESRLTAVESAMADLSQNFIEVGLKGTKNETKQAELDNKVLFLLEWAKAMQSSLDGLKSKELPRMLVSHFDARYPDMLRVDADLRLLSVRVDTIQQQQQQASGQLQPATFSSGGFAAEQQSGPLKRPRGDERSGPLYTTFDKRQRLSSSGSGPNSGITNNTARHV